MSNLHQKTSVKNAYILLTVFIIIFGFRLPFAPLTVIDWDETAYWTIAQDIAKGGMLYQTTWDIKGPLLYFIFVPVIKIFGHNILILRFFTTFYLCISMLFIYFISKRIFQDNTVWIPPLVYGLFFQNFGGQASNGELFMMLPIIIAAYYFVCYNQNEKPAFSSLFLCGFFSAAAILIKLTSFFIIIMFPMALIYKKFFSEHYSLRNFISEIGAYFSGFCLIIIATLGCFITRHLMREFYQTYFLITCQYSHYITFRHGANLFLLFLIHAFHKDAITFLAWASAMLIALNIRELSKEQKNTFFLIIALLILSLAGVFSPRNMFPHYYLMMALPYSFLAGMVVSYSGVGKILYFPKAVIVILTILMIFAYWPSSIVQFYYRCKYFQTDQEYKIAEFVKKTTTSNDTIFVLGGPVIYFLSERMAPMKYFMWSSHDLRKWDDILHLKNRMLPVFIANKPKYFICYKDNKIQYLEKFMLQNYHMTQKIKDYTLFEVNKE